MQASAKAGATAIATDHSPCASGPMGHRAIFAGPDQATIAHFLQRTQGLRTIQATARRFSIALFSWNGGIMKATTASSRSTTRRSMTPNEQYYNCDRHPDVVCLSSQIIRINRQRSSSRRTTRNPRRGVNLYGGFRTKGLASQAATRIFKSGSNTPPTWQARKKRICALATSASWSDPSKRHKS